MNDWLYVAGDSTSRWIGTGSMVLRYLVAAFFVMVAVKNLAGDARMASDFQRWGYSDGFRVLTAVLQLAGAGLLLFPRVAYLGAALLACIMVGATYTHVKHDPPATLVSPVVFLVLVGLLLYAYRPPVLR